MNNPDLHCHSLVSDGLLPPAEVVRRAAANGVDALALTDHDDVAGLDEARAAAAEHGLRLIPGVEVSVTWEKTTVHVVGLGVDDRHPELVAGLAGIRSGRDARAERMAAEFDRIGIRGSLEGARRHAKNSNIIGRTHFARFLVDAGIAGDVKKVFERYLAQGKPGYVEHAWTTLAEAVQWIRAAGGVAVLAHPGRYKLGQRQMRALLDEFRGHGGEAVEIISGNHGPDQVKLFARYAREYGLLASRGSDFHGPGESFVDLGKLPLLPEGLTPVWSRF